MSAERIVLRNPRTGVSIAEPPEIAIVSRGKAAIVGVGSAARAAATQADTEIFNPFAHPRSLVSDFTVGEQVLKAFIKRMQPGTLLALAPTVVLHPLGDPVGGFTQIEIRAFHEMALGAGARRVKLWQGRELTDQELQSGVFPSDGLLLS